MKAIQAFFAMKKHVIGAAATICAAALLQFSAASAASAIGTAEVNWENEVVTAVGYGAPSDKAKNPGHARMLAHQAAMLDGFRRLAEQASGIHITAESSISDNISTGDIVAGEVNAVIKRAKVVSESYDEYGNCSVTMEVPLYGVTNSIAKVALKPVPKEDFPPPSVNISVVNNTEIHNGPEVNVDNSVTQTQTVEQTQNNTQNNNYGPGAAVQPTPATPGTTAKPSGSSAAPAPTGMSAQGGYTGLIVDCSGLNLRPVMSPVIKDAERRPIYGYKNLDSAKVIAKGMASYAKSMSGNTSRAGSRPLVVKAIAVEDHNSYPIISTADANRVLTENQASHFLDNCAVVFIR